MRDLRRPAITRPGRRKARWSLVHGWTRPPRRGKHHLDRQPGAGHYSCVDKAELSKSLAEAEWRETYNRYDAPALVARRRGAKSRRLKESLCRTQVQIT